MMPISSSRWRNNLAPQVSADRTPPAPPRGSCRTAIAVPGIESRSVAGCPQPLPSPASDANANHPRRYAHPKSPSYGAGVGKTGARHSPGYGTPRMQTQSALPLTHANGTYSVIGMGVGSGGTGLTNGDHSMPSSPTLSCHDHDATPASPAAPGDRDKVGQKKHSTTKDKDNRGRGRSARRLTAAGAGQVLRVRVPAELAMTPATTPTLSSPPSSSGSLSSQSPSVLSSPSPHSPSRRLEQAQAQRGEREGSSGTLRAPARLIRKATGRR
jgi:hypothetical protein